ncbi:GMC family oxidoreductase [Iodobacter sp.]|uniref:GMC family oxidoreductase n=1 Tax=Iodobacter sp. TaxID=1915058 RepID=UPI0025D8D276|nr:GMC family oxidoreductase N-terminal domain-containing protein [Iodobacter sp.]
MTQFDYVVAGGGSAGCVVVNRLVKAGYKVLLIEAGPKDDTMFIHMPGTFIRVLGTRRTWQYRCEPQAAAANRTMIIPQGRTLGGGSSVNAMIYIRGTQQDYDGWQEQGCSGWGWDQVLPVFKRAEANQRLSGAYHGVDGLLTVSDVRYRHPLSQAFVKAAQETGIAYNDDFNGEQQAGAGFYQTTTYKGRRASTAATYLAQVLNNPLLTVATDCHVCKVLIEQGVATGVVYRKSSGSEITVRATKEVILAAGALATPKLLMLSGIGPAQHLSSFGITPIKDLPAVGEHYQDHLEVPVYGRTKQPISLLGQDHGLNALKHGLQYQLFKTGLLTSNVVESGGFMDTTGEGRPDVQFHVLPVLAGDADRAPLAGHGISLNVCFLRPKSRGKIQLRSTNPLDPIVLDGAYLSHDDDVQTLIRGVKLARKILRAPSLAKVIERELLPSADEQLSDAAIEEHVRLYAKTVYHPACSCRMGNSELNSVVNPRLQVHGIANLRICDASVMPDLISGNTNAPVIMIAERCADFILQDQA